MKRGEPVDLDLEAGRATGVFVRHVTLDVEVPDALTRSGVRVMAHRLAVVRVADELRLVAIERVRPVGHAVT